MQFYTGYRRSPISNLVRDITAHSYISHVKAYEIMPNTSMAYRVEPEQKSLATRVLDDELTNSWFLNDIITTYLDQYFGAITIITAKKDKASMQIKIDKLIKIIYQKAISKPKKIYIKRGNLNNKFTVFNIALTNSDDPMIMLTPYQNYCFGEITDKFTENIIDLDNSIDQKDLLNFLDKMLKRETKIRSTKEIIDVIPFTIEYVYFRMLINKQSDEYFTRETDLKTILNKYPKMLDYLANLI